MQIRYKYGTDCTEAVPPTVAASGTILHFTFYREFHAENATTWVQVMRRRPAKANSVSVQGSVHSCPQKRAPESEDVRSQYYPSPTLLPPNCDRTPTIPESTQTNRSDSSRKASRPSALTSPS